MVVLLLCKRMSLFGGIMYYNIFLRDITSTTFSQMVQETKVVFYLQLFWVCFNKQVNKLEVVRPQIAAQTPSRPATTTSPKSPEAQSLKINRGSLLGDIKCNREHDWDTKLNKWVSLYTELRTPSSPCPVLLAEHQQQEHIPFPPGTGLKFRSGDTKSPGVKL